MSTNTINNNSKFQAATRGRDPDVVIHQQTVNTLQKKQHEQRNQQRLAQLLQKEEGQIKKLIGMGFTEAEARRMIEAKRDDDMVSAAAAAAAAVAVAKGEEEFDPFELPASAKIVELNEQPLLAQAKTEKIRFSDDHVITTEWIPFVDNGVSKGFWGVVHQACTER